MDSDALQRTLDAIDAVTTCGWCKEPLTADSPSPNYCCEAHQELWLARHAGRAVDTASAALLDESPLADTWHEAREIWTQAPRLDIPVPVGEVLEQIRADFLARLSPPPMLFTYTTPDTRLTSYRNWVQRSLAYSIGLSHHEPRTLLRDINIA